jgi:hypothetical protein
MPVTPRSFFCNRARSPLCVVVDEEQPQGNDRQRYQLYLELELEEKGGIVVVHRMSVPIWLPIMVLLYGHQVKHHQLLDGAYWVCTGYFVYPFQK